MDYSKVYHIVWFKFGILFGHCQKIFGYGLFSHLDWNPSIYWPNNNNLVSGKKIKFKIDVDSEVHTKPSRIIASQPPLGWWSVTSDELLLHAKNMMSYYINLDERPFASFIILYLCTQVTIGFKKVQNTSSRVL